MPSINNSIESGRASLTPIEPSTGKDIIIVQTYLQNVVQYQLDENYYPILSSKETITIQN